MSPAMDTPAGAPPPPLGHGDATRQARKPWLRVQAECLLAGFPAVLIDNDDGRPMLAVTRWALTRSFVSIAEAEAWLARVTGKLVSS